jgi:cytohesin
MKSLILFLVLFAPALQGQRNTASEMLAKASRLGDLKSAETLVSSGVDPNLPDQYGRTPLYYAALFNRNDVAALLLAHRADPNIQAHSGTPGTGLGFPQTPLQIAASMSNLHMASMLTAAGARVNAKTEAGRTALHFAVVGSHLDVIRFLIEKGANVNMRDADGTSPLDDAIWRGYLDATAILLANGARMNEAETKTGATPINEAAYCGKTQLVRYLLQFHPDLLTSDKRGYTPLENAIRMGNTDPALSLLQAAPNEQKTPEFLNRMVGAAIRKDASAVVEALLRDGARANDILSSGATPLDAAASAGAIKVVRVLLHSDADPNKRSRNGTSPLEGASLKGFDAIAEMLLDYGARVNQVNTASGTTALYAAAAFGKGDVVRLLLKHGANPNACGNGHMTPYKAALENAYSEIATQIRDHGGSTESKPERTRVE